MSVERSQAVFAALADPTRRSVLHAVASGGLMTEVGTQWDARLAVLGEAVRRG